jgi:Family of unknown function (DUF6931)
MNDRELKLIPGSATEAVPGFAPVGEGVPAPAPGQTPLEYVQGLASSGHFSDAEGFLASALPRREAVWWACRCVRSTLGSEPSREADLAVRAAEAWAVAPGDVNRRKAMPVAEAVGFGHPAGCVALAAFLSGGSLVPPGLKEVPPPGDAFARALAGSILLAAARAEPGAIVETHRRFLDLGLAVARGEDRWKNPT